MDQIKEQKAQDVDGNHRQEELFTSVKWAGVLDLFKCQKCDQTFEDKDDVILHVINHVPECEREDLLEKLTQGDKK